MISISATGYDPVGFIMLNTFAVNPYLGVRRGTITATLDGKSSAFDGGYSESDHIMRATIKNATVDQLKTMKYLVSYYPRLIVACETGVYESVISFGINNRSLSMTIQTLNRLNV